MMTFFAKKRLRGVRDWAKDLTQFCSDAELSFAECNFHVTKVYTMTKKDDKEVPANFFKEKYNQTSDEIYQIFDFEVTAREFDFSKLNFSFNQRHLEAVLVLKEGFFIGVREEYMMQLLDHIIAFLIHKGIIIFDIEKMKLRLEKIINENFQPPCTLMQERRFVFLRSKADVKKEGFTNLLEEKWCRENNKPPMPNALYAIMPGDHIGFFLKNPIFSSGRNLQGEFMDMKTLYLNTPKTDDKGQDSNSETGTVRYKSAPEAGAGINVIMDGDVVKYEAQANGIIEFLESGLQISEAMSFQQVGRTNSILGGVGKQTDVSIECTDPSKDAVQNGAVIEADNVTIKGVVGEKVVIKAKQLSIEGQTHSSAVFYADDANITIHKGVLYGKNVSVDKLEGGRVYGEDVNILEAQSSKIVGDRILISKLHSTTQIKFCETLHLKEISGNDNQISFDVFANWENRQKMSTVLMRDSLLRSNITGRVIYCKTLAAKLRKLKPIIENLKPIIDRSKKEGYELDNDTKKTLGFYVLLLRQIKEQKDKATKMQKMRTENSQVGRELEHALNGARVSTESSWKDGNQIILSRRFPMSTERLFAHESEMFEIYIDNNGFLQKEEQSF